MEGSLERSLEGSLERRLEEFGGVWRSLEEVWRKFGGELEGIGPLLLKEGMGWLGQQRSNRKMVIVIVIVKKTLCLCASVYS